MTCGAVKAQDKLETIKLRLGFINIAYKLVIRLRGKGEP